MKKDNSIQIAIADDHVIMRNGLSTLISSFPGFKVMLEADNGKELIEQLERSSVQPDIVILDISMPVLNGYETLIALKKKWPDIKVLVLSMYNNEFSIIRMLRNGAKGYILKACDPKELHTALMDIHTRGFYNSELVSSRFFQLIHSNNEHLLPKISEKEFQFLNHCCTELNYREIAQLMGMSTRTVEGYRDSLFEKLNLNTRIGLVMYAINTGIVPINQAPSGMMP
jgi:DNA-binding NarL/FixJ family response regulator